MCSHPHKTPDHAHGSATDPSAGGQHGNALRGSDTGDNIANPFNEPNAAAAEHSHRHGTHTDAGGIAVHNVAGSNSRSGMHDDHRTATTHTARQHHASHHEAGGTGVGSAAGSDGRSHHVPGVNTGGADVVGARMPVEEGNNFPGTNPHPAHDALKTGAEGGLTFPGGK